MYKLKAETHYATNRCDTSWRQVASSVLLLREGGLRLFCRCDKLQEFKPVRIIFVRPITATNFRRSDNYFHMSHEAICWGNLSRRRVAAICCIVCLGFREFRANCNLQRPHRFSAKCKPCYILDVVLLKSSEINGSKSFLMVIA